MGSGDQPQQAANWAGLWSLQAVFRESQEELGHTLMGWEDQRFCYCYPGGDYRTIKQLHYLIINDNYASCSLEGSSTLRSPNNCFKVTTFRLKHSYLYFYHRHKERLFFLQCPQLLLFIRRADQWKFLSWFWELGRESLIRGLGWDLRISIPF